MLVTMLTAMYMLVRVAEQLGVRWVRQPEPLPYVVSQPLPWQVHNVSHTRKGSRSEEYEGHRRNSIGVYRKHSSSSNGHTEPRPTRRRLQFRTSTGSTSRRSRKITNERSTRLNCQQCPFHTDQDPVFSSLNFITPATHKTGLH